MYSYTHRCYSACLLEKEVWSNQSGRGYLTCKFSPDYNAKRTTTPYKLQNFTRVASVYMVSQKHWYGNAGPAGPNTTHRCRNDVLT